MPVILNAGEGSYVLLLKRMKRIAIAQDCQPQGCGCRAYMDVFTACLEQWLSFSSFLLVCTKM